MPGAKVHIIDELETLKEHCRNRRQKQNSTLLQMNSNEFSYLIAKKTAPKYVLRMMSSINFSNIFGADERAVHDDDEDDDSPPLWYDNDKAKADTEGNAAKLSPASRTRVVKQTAKDFVADVHSDEHIGHIVDKLTTKKVDFEELIRNTDIDKKTIDRKFSVYEHIKLKNEAGAVRYLPHYFGSGSSVRVSVGNEFPQVLKIADGRIEGGKKSNVRFAKGKESGMVIFVNVDFSCEHSCTLLVSGRTLPHAADHDHDHNSHDSVGVTYKTTFWSNGDTNGLVLTTRHNAAGASSVFGGAVPAKDGRSRYKSLPGWNGRVPMWVPFNECECSITRCHDTDPDTAPTTAPATHSSNQEASEGGAGTGAWAMPRAGLPSPNSTYNFQNTFGSWQDAATPNVALSCAEASPYDTKVAAPPRGHSSSSSRLRADGDVAYLTVYACPSPEEALSKLTKLAQKFELKETAGTTLHGNMPALSLAALHGNVIAVRKLLKAGANPNRVAACSATTPLHDAVAGGHHDVMKLLLEFRANQTQCDEHGMTPLHLCCVNNDVTGARILLQHKDAKRALAIHDRQGRTPRMACSRKHLQEVVGRECKKHGLKEKRAASWWSNLAGSSAERPSGQKKATAEDFMKMAVLVAKHRSEGQAPSPAFNNNKVVL